MASIRHMVYFETNDFLPYIEVSASGYEVRAMGPRPHLRTNENLWMPDLLSQSWLSISRQNNFKSEKILSKASLVFCEAGVLLNLNGGSD